MERLTIGHMEYIAHRLAREMLAFNEPIPDFSTRFEGRLESCLAAPFMSFARKELYYGLTAKAAILFYLLNKNHPFQNGNKRIAVTALFVFLYHNGKWLEIRPETLYTFSVHVAASKPRYKEAVVKEIEIFIKEHWVDL